MNTKWILCICALAAALGGCASTQSPEAPSAPPPAQDPAPVAAPSDEAAGATRAPSMDEDGAAPAAGDTPAPGAPAKKKPADAKQKGGVIIDD